MPNIATDFSVLPGLSGFSDATPKDHFKLCEYPAAFMRALD